MDFDYVVMPAIIFVIGILIVWLSIRRILSLSRKSYRMWRKVAERIVLSIVALVATVVAGSSSFNAIALHHFRATNPPPGAIYTVNGHRMHINCTGSGSPTIVLESGLGNDALIWGGVQPELSKTTRVCSYDRAGFGWSEALAAPRDADHIAGELHELLHQANVSGPIVLMGHSIAGIYLRDYASHYPADIAGIVFVDVTTPLADEHPAMKALSSKDPPLWISLLLMRAPFIAGFPRLMGQCSLPPPGFTGQVGRLEAEDICHMQFSAMAAERYSFNQSGHETAHTGPYGALPILILSEDTTMMHLPLSPQQTADVMKIFNQMQEDLKKLSTHSRRIIAKGSGHYVQLMRADLIEKEVPLFIEQIRGTAPQPTNYGSTTTE
jgi:pimeloyl-ACP methyl ester carboxylesterase